MILENTKLLYKFYNNIIRRMSQVYNCLKRMIKKREINKKNSWYENLSIILKHFLQSYSSISDVKYIINLFYINIL